MADYVAHYGKKYRNGAVRHWLYLPVTGFSEDGKAQVCSPNGWLYDFDSVVLLHRLGLVFMEVTRAEIKEVPDRGTP